ncbi:hypothetical protein [Pararhodobacter sp. CCB-MM2]|uniref:hypothetical protein n=1 Tax=Pararhodobacter sp. CCB-MM2 TaxID=1786003 RepID=UPI0008331158|nr:hypothetical protein [Pararhodobacter sp. CCB-MM2]
MQIDSTKDFKRPRAKVLQNFRNPERFESVMRGMDITVTRVADPAQLAWDCSIHWNNAPRAFRAVLTEVTQDETMVLAITSDLANATINMDFYDLPEGGCRVITKADITARSMMIKLALQSLRLVRGKAEEKLTRLVTAFGKP